MECKVQQYNKIGVASIFKIFNTKLPCGKKRRKDRKDQDYLYVDISKTLSILIENDSIEILWKQDNSYTFSTPMLMPIFHDDEELIVDLKVNMVAQVVKKIQHDIDVLRIAKEVLSNE